MPFPAFKLVCGLLLEPRAPWWLTMMPAERFSGRRNFSPSLHSQWIFSHVTMTSPMMASSSGLPESRADTLRSASNHSGATKP